MDRLLTRAEVEAKTIMSTTSIYRLMRAGVFPGPLKIGPRAVRWGASEIDQYVESRPGAQGQAVV